MHPICTEYGLQQSDKDNTMDITVSDVDLNALRCMLKLYNKVAGLSSLHSPLSLIKFTVCVTECENFNTFTIHNCMYCFACS